MNRKDTRTFVFCIICFSIFNDFCFRRGAILILFNIIWHFFLTNLSAFVCVCVYGGFPHWSALNFANLHIFVPYTRAMARVYVCIVFVLFVAIFVHKMKSNQRFKARDTITSYFAPHLIENGIVLVQMVLTQLNGWTKRCSSYSEVRCQRPTKCQGPSTMQYRKYV